MSNLIQKLVVKPGSKIKLRDIDPGFHGHHKSHEEAAQDILSHIQKMDQLQYRMYAEKKHSLLIVLQGLDAAGKDGVIRHVLTGLNPAGCRVSGFKQPTAEELDQGEVAVFNRSHYGDVLVVRVHHLAPLDVWSRRYELINNFEKQLAVENGTSIVKSAPSGGSKIPAGDGRSAMPITRSGSAGPITSRHSRKSCARQAPTMRRGASSLLITNGSGTSPCRKSLITRWSP